MAMFSISPNVSEGFDRLQQLLLDLRVGDEIRVSDAAHASGLSEHVCLAMLEGLQRAGLMAQADTNRFVRRRLDFV
jgi:DNA-binding IclR family transcriptional regulator